MRLHQKAAEVARRLALMYPGTARELCELRFDSAFQLLVSTVLSAQTTDAAVNGVTGGLFSRYPDCESLSQAAPAEVEELIKPTGFYRTKAANIVALAMKLRDEFDCQVPDSMDQLVTLPGVGRKTANVILSVWFKKPGLPVDTHVKRLSKRIGLTDSDDPVVIEAELCEQLPPDSWGAFSLQMILHGRRICKAKGPLCPLCSLSELCDYYETNVIGKKKEKFPS